MGLCFSNEKIVGYVTDIEGLFVRTFITTPSSVLFLKQLMVQHIFL